MTTWCSRALNALFLGGLLAGCAAAAPLAQVAIPGDHRQVALCARAGLLVGERDILFVDDPAEKIAWVSQERGDFGPGLRNFRVAFRQIAERTVSVEVLSVGGVRFDQEVFLSRLNAILADCSKG